MSVEGSLALGNQGDGNLNIDGRFRSAAISSWARVRQPPGFMAPTGFLSVNAGGQFSAGSGQQSHIGIGGSGTLTKLTAKGAGATVNLNGLVIIGSGGEGTMYVSGGAAARINAGELGATPGSFGSLTVYNSGTTAAVDHYLSVGGVSGTAGGPGFVDVDDDALLTVHFELSISATGKVTVGPVALPDGSAAGSGGRIFVGTDNFGPDGAVRVGNRGILCGKGKQTGTAVLAQNVVGKVIIGAGGRFEPGADPDVFSIQGDCDLSDDGAGGGTTEFEVAGAGTAGTDYDELMVSGATTLGGTLRLVLLNGYTPKVGDTFNFIQSGSQTGSFAQIVSPSLTVSQTPGATGLSVTVTGITSTAAPAISSDATATAYVGTPFDFEVSASNDAAGFGATGLPDGLSIDAATGQISGTPTTAGSYPVALTATNASGTGTATLTITVAAELPPGAPTITSAATADAQTGATFMYQIDASNSPTSYAAAGLPPGLSVDANAGLISGMPAQTGTFAVALTATNASGAGTATLTLTVTTPLPVAMLSVTTPTVTAGSGGAAAFKVTLSPAPTAPLTIKYSIKGTATNGVDYTLLTGKVKFKAGKTSKPIKIIPLGDLGGASKKTVKIAIVARPGYTVGSAAPLKVKILAP